MPAVFQLFDMMLFNANFARNSFLRQALANVSSHVKSKPRYTRIWQLELVLYYILAVQGDPTKLPWTAFMATAAFVWMVFVPCRPIALIRADPTLARIDPTSKAILLPVQEKTDHGRGGSIL
jgi:hypothetical protein